MRKMKEKMEKINYAAILLAPGAARKHAPERNRKNSAYESANGCGACRTHGYVVLLLKQQIHRKTRYAPLVDVKLVIYASGRENDKNGGGDRVVTVELDSFFASKYKYAVGGCAGKCEI